MSVSVNLQEVFSSDSQSNLTQKINFNFNQLLTLGLGEPGIQGPVGPQGPIGPAGPVGPQGSRGARVYSVQTTEDPISNPNLAQNSENGDLFINTREIYVKGVTISGVWGEVVDFQSLINSQSLQDTYKVFQMGFGSGESTSRNAKFLRTNGIDLSNSGLATSHPMYYDITVNPGNNTQLVLSNFDELKTWRIQTGALVQNNTESDDIHEYTSIAKIYSFLPSSLTGYRHQLELGSVDEIGISVGGNTQAYVLTPTEQNLKFRKYRVASSGLAGGIYNRADIDLSGPVVSANSTNGEIILSVNKRTGSATQLIEMGLTTAQILSDRLSSQALGTDGLIMSRGGTHHISFGFDDSLTSQFNLRTSTNLRILALNHATLNMNNGNLAISLADPAKEISLGTAIKVKNDRLSQGLPFPPIMVASSDPNTLDDYEEGTWTPTVETNNTMVYGADNNAGNNWQITSAIGRYVKIGKAIFITFSVRVRFVLDSGVTFPDPDVFPTQVPLELGFTSTNVSNYGTETFGMRIGGLPFGSSDVSSIFSISVAGVGSNISALRTDKLYANVDTGQSMTPIILEPIVPGSIYGKYYCHGSINATPKIALYGHRYRFTNPTSDRVSGVVSRVQPHDFLRTYTISNSEFTEISGSGWILDNGSCGVGDDYNEVGGDPGGGSFEDL